ncbi:MAG: diacylglycerol kinase [Cardiobacteriaceae bacterium]|nr:diacylglycerol kinase [Cardiobacteriaceae bacterium]
MDNNPHKIKGLKHFFKAAQFSKQGLQSALKETAFQHELYLCLLGLPLALWLGETGSEKALLVGSLLLVLVVELLNSAIEAVVDRIGLEYHELSGKAKDYGSAAVMVTLFITGLVWLLVLWG